MLYLKYPERFNVLGQVMWRGTIPGLARTLPGGSRKRIFWGPRARGFFQSVYEAEQGIVKFLPQTLEWQLFCALVLAASFAVGLTLLPGLAMLAMGPVWAMYYATQAPIQKSHDRLSSRCLVALLSYVGPIARALTRYRLRLLGAWSAKNEMEQAPRQRPSIDLISRGLRLNYWNEKQVTRDGLLDRLSHLLVNAGHPVVQDSGWNEFDLEVRPDAWTRVEIKTADEEHGSGRLKNLVLARVRLTPLTYIPVLALVSGAVASSLMGLSSPAVVLAGLGFVAAAFAIAEGFESAQLVYRVIEGCAAELDLIPLGTPTAAAREQAATAQATSPANAKKDMAPVESMSEDRPLVD
jgi:hypothetical protein